MVVMEVVDLVVVVLDHYDIVHSWDLSHGLEVVWIIRMVGLSCMALVQMLELLQLAGC